MALIEFKQVSKRFLPANDGLVGVSFSISPGDSVFITGPSGAGKTTLLRLLTREYVPTEGSVFFEDQDLGQIRNRQIDQHRRKIGVVFQDYKLVPELTVWENIALPLQIVQTPESQIKQRIVDLLALIGMGTKAQLFPKQLSGGEAQRISIARALALAPKVIFADEPTGNLDSETTFSIIDLLHKINGLGTTLLIATHDQEVLNKYPSIKRIALKKDGEKEASKNPSVKKEAPKDSSSKKESQVQKQKVKTESKQENTPPQKTSFLQRVLPFTKKSIESSKK